MHFSYWRSWNNLLCLITSKSYTNEYKKYKQFHWVWILQFPSSRTYKYIHNIVLHHKCPLESKHRDEETYISSWYQVRNRCIKKIEDRYNGKHIPNKRLGSDLNRGRGTDERLRFGCEFVVNFIPNIFDFVTITTIIQRL